MTSFSVGARSVEQFTKNQRMPHPLAVGMNLAFPLLTPVESATAHDAEPPPIILFRIWIDRLSGVGEGF